MREPSARGMAQRKLVVRVVDVFTDAVSEVAGATADVNRALRQQFPAASARAGDLGFPAMLEALRSSAFVLVLDADAYAAASALRRRAS